MTLIEIQCSRGKKARRPTTFSVQSLSDAPLFPSPLHHNSFSLIVSYPRNNISTATNGFSPQEISHLITSAGVAKARLTWPDYILKSFFGGLFISLGGLIDLAIVSGSASLRSSDPSLATLIGGFLFPLGFVLITLTNMELCTSNMFIMPYTTLQKKTTVWDLLKNWAVTYVVNIAGALFVAGFLAWWSDVLQTDEAIVYAVSQAEGRVNVKWSVNFLRGVGCNFLVGMAFFVSLGSVDFVSKVFTIWIPVWTFVIAGYQRSIANYFMVPIGMFYGVDFSGAKFIYQSVIPVTLGNMVGGALLGAVPFWYLYGRGEAANVQTGQSLAGQGAPKQEVESEESIGRHRSGPSHACRGPGQQYDCNGMIDAA